MELSVIFTSTNKIKAWLLGVNGEKNQTLPQGTYGTKALPDAPHSCPSFIPFSTWHFKLLRPMAVFYYSVFFPPFHLQPVPHCTAMQILQCNLCYPRVQPGLMNSIWLKCETSPLACYLHRRSGLRQLDIQTRGSPGCLGGLCQIFSIRKRSLD